MLARGPAKAEKHLTKRFLQGALPALLGFGLVLFAAHTAIDAYHSFRQLEGSRSSNLILASRSILDQSNVLELSRRKFSDGMGTIAAIDEAELRENLLQLVLNVSRSRRSLGADPVLREQFELRTRDLLAEARALIAYLDQVGTERPDDYWPSVNSGIRELDDQFTQLRDDLDRQSVRFITEQSDLLSKSLSGMQKMFFSLFGAVLSVLALLELNRRSARQAEFRANHDAMTGALNRRAFENWLNRSATSADSRPQAVIILDLDEFKDINDEFGHLAGDTVIKAFVDSVKRQFGPETRLVRWGGDEFVLVVSLDDAVEAGAVTMLRQAFGNIQTAVEFDGANISISCSGGAAFYPADSSDLREVLQFADLALFNAKTRGKGCLRFFDREMQNERHRVHALRERLRRALSEGELTLYWQPQIDIVHPHINSAEALIRWIDAKTGRMIPPGEFIPVAETSDLILAIDHFVLDEAIRVGARWAEIWSHPPTVAVNVSALHFEQRGFTDLVRDLLRKHGMHPSQLELEITEGVVLGDNAEVKRNLDSLALLGVRLALDDFGTGYSNIAYLSHLKPDRLKIDQTFVRRLVNNPHIRSLVAAIIGIGRAIDCEVVAEGVETAEQLAEIKALGCRLVQGFYFAHPMPMDEFEAWREMAGYSDEATSAEHLRRYADRMVGAET